MMHLLPCTYRKLWRKLPVSLYDLHCQKAGVPKELSLWILLDYLSENYFEIESDKILKIQIKWLDNQAKLCSFCVFCSLQRYNSSVSLISSFCSTFTWTTTTLGGATTTNYWSGSTTTPGSTTTTAGWTTTLGTTTPDTTTPGTIPVTFQATFTSRKGKLALFNLGRFF